MAVDANLHICKYKYWVKNSIALELWQHLKFDFLACSQRCQFSDSTVRVEDVCVYKNTAAVQHLVGFVIYVGAKLLNWSDNFSPLFYSALSICTSHLDMSWWLTCMFTTRG